MKVNNKKGFTLAELLIVVAIIGVLVAVAIPTFGSQLEKSRQAVDEANCRSAYAELVANYMIKDGDSTVEVAGVSYAYKVSGDTITVGTHDATKGNLKSDHYKGGIDYNGTSYGTTGVTP